MAKLLLTEYYELCEGGVCQDLLTEQEKAFVANGGMILSGVMQRAEAQNGNGRVYPRAVLMREMETYTKLVKERRALGELDHPDDSVINLNKQIKDEYLIVEFLEKCEKVLSSMTFDIKNLVEIMKMETL